MSGTRLGNFRQGDRAEYLANYLLSALGLVTAVPRQEDVGFDFYCQLADQETGLLSFGFPFIVQTKSESVSSIVYGTTDSEKWRKEQTEWLFRLEQPLFFTAVDRKNVSMKIYDSSSIAFLYGKKIPTILEFKFGFKSGQVTVGEPDIEKIEGWTDVDKGNGNKCTVYLGEPLVTIDNSDTLNSNVLRRKKDLLRIAIAINSSNILYRKFQLPFFQWLQKVEPAADKDNIVGGFWYNSLGTDKFINHHALMMKEGLISLALTVKEAKREDLLTNLKPFLQKIPAGSVHDVIKMKFPEIWG